MRVYLHYDASDPKFVIKVKLPKKWLAGPTDNLKATLVDNYNSKHPEHVLDGGAFHLELKDGVVLCSDELVSKRVPDRADIFLIPGASTTVAAEAAASKAKLEAEKPKEDPNDPLLRCRRFGCRRFGYRRFGCRRFGCWPVYTYLLTFIPQGFTHKNTSTGATTQAILTK